jgi:hypothetical protein
LNDSHLETISNLPNLTSLNLSAAGTDGQARLEAVCNTLSSLTSLRHLDLGEFIFAEQTKRPPRQWSPLGLENQSRLIERLKCMSTLEILTLPSGIKDWAPLNELPSLKCLGLSEDDLQNVCDPVSQAVRSNALKILDSWILRIEAFKAPVLFQNMFGWKDSLLQRAVGSGKLELVSRILSVPRKNPSLNVNFFAFGGQSLLVGVSNPKIIAALVDAGAAPPS